MWFMEFFALKVFVAARELNLSRIAFLSMKHRVQMNILLLVFVGRGGGVWWAGWVRDGGGFRVCLCDFLK